MVVVIVTIAGLLGGCTNGGDDVNGVDPDLTLEDAKHTAMAMERELAGMVPSENVLSIDQHETGVLMSCDDDRGYQWSGRTNVIVQGVTDPEKLVDAIVADYSKRQDFTAERETTIDGQPRAHILGHHGAGYLVAESVDKTAIEIMSFSPCFVLPEDMSPRGDY